MSERRVMARGNVVTSSIPVTINHVVQFDDAVANEINQHVQLAGDIWHEAVPDLSEIRFTAGNYAGYGRYGARCLKSGIVEIPIGNRFRLLTIDSNNRLVHPCEDRQRLLGIVLHEIAHHVVTTSVTNPWTGGPQIAASTHLCKSWLWICSTGWNHFHNLNLSASQIVESAKLDRDLWTDALTHFNPYRLPPNLATPKTMVCSQCGVQFIPSRHDAKFCSAKCRVYASRQRKDSAQ